MLFWTDFPSQQHNFLLTTSLLPPRISSLSPRLLASQRIEEELCAAVGPRRDAVGEVHRVVERAQRVSGNSDGIMRMVGEALAGGTWIAILDLTEE